MPVAEAAPVMDGPEEEPEVDAPAEEQYEEEPEAALAAQRIVLDLYRLDLRLRR